MVKQLVRSFRERLRCWPRIPLVFEIETITIQAKSRRLSVEYTVEVAQDIKFHYGIDVEKEIIDALHHH
jgi:hypothetical protein